MTRHYFFMITILALLCLAAAGCTLPAGTPNSPAPATPTAVPPAGTPSGAPSVTIIPKDPDDTPEPVSTDSPVVPTHTREATVAPSAVVTPTYQPVDPKDPGAIIAGVRAALQQKDVRFFAQFAPENLNYIDYIEGGQPVERAKLLADLTSRFAASSSQCTQYGTFEQTLQVWTSTWIPLWQIDQICYQGCSPLNPPHTNQTAAFFFNPNPNGEYELTTVWINDDNLWRTIFNVEMHPCSEPYQPPVTPTAFSCPGAPAARLKPGQRAYASDQTATPSRVRSAPGTGTEILGLIQPRQVVNILAGPQCAQGYVWWKVRLQEGDLTGWTAEGQGSSYWLEPCTVAKCGQP